MMTVLAHCARRPLGTGFSKNSIKETKNFLTLDRRCLSMHFSGDSFRSRKSPPETQWHYRE